MKKKTIIWISVATGVAGLGFWLWYRQKNAITAAGIQQLQRLRTYQAAVAALATKSPAGIFAGEFSNDQPLPQ